MGRARLVALAAASALGLLAPAARAEPTKRECIDANAQAQVALKAGRLSAAKAALQSCAVTACPSAVSQDCTQRLDTVAPRVPSIILAVKDAAGHALTAVRVRLDDKPLTTKIDETAYDLDPGDHKLVFEVDGEAPVTSNVTVREREVGHRVEVVIGAKASPVAPPPEATVIESGPKPAPGHTQRIAGIAVGSIGVAGLVVGAVLGGMASSKWSSSTKACSKDACDRTTTGPYDAAVAARTSAEHLATGSTIGFVAGGILAAGGVVLYLTAPRQSHVGLAPTANGALLVGSF